MFIRLLFFFGFFGVATGQAAIQIPNQLGAADRQALLRILGYGTSFKTSGDPYPLGGYMGFEIGVSYELLSTAPIAKLGSGTGIQGDTSLLNITVGKGLFYDVDFYLNFSPLGQVEKISSYGGALRWGIYELEDMPIHFSLQAAANTASFQNKINLTTQNFDLIGGWNFQDVVFFGGVGMIRSSGQFIGGASGVNNTTETMTEAVHDTHSFAGISVKYGTYFLALQMDRATQTAYALKLGTRY